jgi:WD40 repeat protein
MRDAFVHALTKSEDHLRFLLCIEADDLKTLRWERLCAPVDQGWDFLALTQRTPFSLYLPSLTDRCFPPIGRRDLRALALVASPQGLERYRLEPFEVNTAVSCLRAALGEIPCDVLAICDGAVGPPTLDALCARMTAEQYTLLHVVSHGQLLRENGETVLYLAKSDQQVDPVDGTRLLERLGRLRGAQGLPHFAFLATCESASPEAEGALGGLAQRLVRELGMPAVIAMTEKVSVVTAQALWEGFYRRLREHGMADGALVEACAGLAERYDITVPALYSRLAGRPLFSDTLDRPLTNEEIRFGLARLETLLAERAPVLPQECQEHAAKLRGALGADLAALSADARQEGEQALAELNKLCGEVLDLSFNALALGQEPPAYDGRCPFRGLYPFRVDDREFFFGRETLVDHLQQKLADHPFLAVLGPSGSGKSSLVLAGLIPALQSKQPGVQMTYLTPGADPLAQLEATSAPGHNERAVLVVDQFEEVFTLCTDEAKRQAFLERVLTLVEEQRIVLTMRADFWGECAPYRGLKEAMQAYQELIGPMDAAELRRAMELQARKVGLRFEADLSSAILDEVRGEPGAMPLLQHALLELWNRRHGRRLRADEYRALGGVQQAIARTAEDVYKQLSSTEHDRVRDIFVRLTRLDDEAVPGEERRDTRRRVGAEELAPVGSDPATTRVLVKRLADARLIVTSVNTATDREEVEVAHEALIRYWPRLRGWLDEDRASLRVREGIREAAQEWGSGRKEDNLLVHRGSRLEDAEALSHQPRFALNELERAYLEACVAWREKERERQRRTARFRLGALGAIGGLIIIALGIGLWSVPRDAANQRTITEQQQVAKERAESFAREQERLAREAATARDEAEARRVEAERQQQIALARQLAAQAELVRNQRADLLPRSVLLAVESMRRFPSLEGDQVLRPGLAILPRPLVRLVHEGDIRTLVFSPDGQWLATGSADRTAHVWDVATGREIVRIRHAIDVQALAFSADGRLLMTADQDDVRVWKTDTGAQVAHRRQQSRPTAIVLTLGGEWLATQGYGRTARVWEPRTGRELLRVPFDDSIEAAAFSPDGNYLAAAGFHRTRVWEILSGKELPPIYLDGRWRLTFSPGGQWLAMGTSDRTVRVWQVDNGSEVQQIRCEGCEDHAIARAFSPDSRWLAVYADRSLQVREVRTNKEVARVVPGVGPVAFSPNGRLLTTWTADNTITIWEITPEPEMAQLAWEVASEPDRHEKIGVSAVAFAPDGTWLASGWGERTVQVWEATTGRNLAQVNHRGEMELRVALSATGQWLATLDEDGTVQAWEVATGQRVPTLAPEDPVQAISFSPDGTRLAMASGNRVRVQEVKTGQLVAEVPHEGRVWAIAFSPDRRQLATGARKAPRRCGISGLRKPWPTWSMRRGSRL